MSPAEVCVCVFAKRPAPGLTKTRLAAALGDERAAELARAFFDDTWAALEANAWADPIVATTEPSWCAGQVGADRVWLQGDGDLGERLERVLRRALSRSGRAIALGSDSPGMPRALLEQAREALGAADAVLGPCDDGGFYLLGVKQCPTGLLSGLPWSRECTLTRTLARLRASGLRTALLPPWFDVDESEDLRRLARLLERHRICAPRTAARLMVFGFSSSAQRTAL